jgi:hypothetical protein
MNKSLARIAAATTTLLALSGCGGSDSGQDTAHTPSPTSTSTSTGSPSQPSGTVIDVTINGEEVTPNGERLDAKVGEPITLVVTSDREGELHVHSSPEQELAYGVGKTTLNVTIDKPGIVDIEDHIADVVVVQLQVS